MGAQQRCDIEDAIIKLLSDNECSVSEARVILQEVEKMLDCNSVIKQNEY